MPVLLLIIFCYYYTYYYIISYKSSPKAQQMYNETLANGCISILPIYMAAV